MKFIFHSMSKVVQYNKIFIDSTGFLIDPDFLIKYGFNHIEINHDGMTNK